MLCFTIKQKVCQFGLYGFIHTVCHKNVWIEQNIKTKCLISLAIPLRVWYIYEDRREKDVQYDLLHYGR